MINRWIDHWILKRPGGFAWEWFRLNVAIIRDRIMSRHR